MQSPWSRKKVKAKHSPSRASPILIKSIVITFALFPCFDKKCKHSLNAKCEGDMEGKTISRVNVKSKGEVINLFPSMSVCELVVTVVTVQGRNL